MQQEQDRNFHFSSATPSHEATFVRKDRKDQQEVPIQGHTASIEEARFEVRGCAGRCAVIRPWVYIDTTCEKKTKAKQMSQEGTLRRLADALERPMPACIGHHADGRGLDPPFTIPFQYEVCCKSPWFGRDWHLQETVAVAAVQTIQPIRHFNC